MKELFTPYTIGHFINEPASPTQFEITLFEEMNEPDVNDVHRHSFYEILWVDQGRSRQIIDYKSYELHPRSLFFISPAQVHEFEEWQNLKGGTILFTEEFFLKNHPDKDKLFELIFLDNVYFNPNILLECADYGLFRNYINLLIEEKNRKNSSPEILQSLLHILLLQIQRSIDGSQIKTSKRNVVLYKKIKHLLELNFSTSFTANNYAAMLNITTHHLNRIVKEITGRTVTAVIRSRSILEAKRFLSFTDLTIAEIASQLNYFDSSYFSKIFKADTGKTPFEFRSEMSAKYRKR
jgi:AraC-like DNA-binding protein